MNILQYLLEKYPDKPWCWNNISYNPNITMEIIEKYPEKPWSWYFISENQNITMEMIEKYPDKPWCWKGISCNPNITMEFIKKKLDKIDFTKLFQNEFIFENIRMKKKESYMLLEKERCFHKLINLFIVTKYM